ncbi:MAG: type II secretion system secretin GspD [Brevirhabdus sp.]
MLALALMVVSVASGLHTARAQVNLDLRDADLRSFVQIVAEATGRSFILDPGVQGTVTVLAPRDVTTQAIYEIFLNILELNRLTIVEGNEADRIVPLSTARELAPGQAEALRGGAYETRVIRLQNAPVNEVAEVIRPLLPAEAVLSTVPASNILILSDRRENQRKIETLVTKLDQRRERPIETVRVAHANAVELLGVIQALDIAPAGASLSADRRSNAILVSGPREFRERVRNVVAELDTPQKSLTTQVVVLNYADAREMADVVRRTFIQGAAEGGGAGTNGVNIVAEPQSNALLITAPSDRIRSIAQAIVRLDKRPSQVLVEAVIFEMSVENFSDLTVQFGAILDEALAGGVQFSLEGRPSLTNLVSTALAGGTPDVGNGGSLGALHRSGNNGIGGFISALASKTSTRLLSTPSIMTLNNEEAEIVVAQNVPFVTGSFAQVGESAVPDQPFQTIERQDVGLTLKVTPQINADNTVRMAIKQEVSSLTNGRSAAGAEITAKRTLSTNVLVRDRRVIILGGLLEDGSGSVGQRVPGLSRLPLIGGAFRGRNATKNQRVLLVMLRPRIVNSDEDARRISREVAREAKRASQAIRPIEDGQYPAVPQGGFPFDGADLNQPFDAGFVDGVAQSRNFPPLPSRLRFNAQ